MQNQPETVISLLHKLRKYYAKHQMFHYLSFAALAIILLLDFLIIIYTQAESLNAYAWAGIIFLFVLMAVEGKQYMDFKELKANVDDFYMIGEYEWQAKKE